MRPWRQMIKGRTGTMAAGLILVAGAAGLWRSGTSVFGRSEAAAVSQKRWMVCATTGRAFEAQVEAGSSIPVWSPHSRELTGYPAERCYWTREGAIAEKPTLVLVRSYLGEQQPTFCGECGRRVVARNPAPMPGRPPPTREEYAAQSKPMEEER